MTRKAGASSAPALRLLGWLKARRLRIPLVCFGPARFIVHCLQAASFGADWSRADRWCNADARAQSGRCPRGGRTALRRPRSRPPLFASERPARYRRTSPASLEMSRDVCTPTVEDTRRRPLQMRRIEVSAWHEGESNIEVPMENLVKIEKA